MNTIYRIVLLAGALTAFSACEKNQPTEPDYPYYPHGRTEVPAETRTLTFVLPDYPVGEDGVVADGLKTSWAAGDQIVVHGEYADEQVIVTLSAGDISSDGKSATLSVGNLHPYKRQDCTSSLYAAYPAKAASTLKHCMYYTSFSDTHMQIMAACDKQDSFKFQNLSGVFSFKVSGDFDAFTLTGRKDVMLSYEVFQVMITDTETNLAQYLQKPVTTIESTRLVADGETTNYVYIPGDVDLHGGFILRFLKDGEAVKTLTDKEAVVLDAGTGLALGDITDRLVDAADDIDPSLAKPVDEAGHANCYVVYESGFYRFAAVKGNTDAVISGVTEADLIWETCNDSEELAPRSVISGVAYDEESGVVCFQVPLTVKPGNALIAVKDEDGNILWSWHIWIPETTIGSGSYGFSSSVTMMDRNLGALVVADENEPDPRGSGLFYQWGRKDPLRAAGSLTEAVDATTAPAGIWTSETAQASLEQARQHPTVMYLNEVWTSDDYAELWATDKTENDPCPPGWKLPTNKGIFEGYWTSMPIADEAWGTYGFRAGAGSESSSVFPYSGFIDCASGAFDFFDAENSLFMGTRLWDVVAYKAGYYRALQIRNDKTHNGTGNIMSLACSIRCIAEE